MSPPDAAAAMAVATLLSPAGVVSVGAAGAGILAAGCAEGVGADAVGADVVGAEAGVGNCDVVGCREAKNCRTERLAAAALAAEESPRAPNDPSPGKGLCGIVC